MIAPLRHLDCAERLQVLGDILRVEQAIAAGLEPRDQMHQRDLGRVARAMKHALAEECAAERDTVKAADKFVAVIDFDGVAMTALDRAPGRCGGCAC